MKQDPLALAFFGAALAVLAGLLLYVLVFKTPEPAPPVRAFDFLNDPAEDIYTQADGKPFHDER